MILRLDQEKEDELRRRQKRWSERCARASHTTGNSSVSDCSDDDARANGAGARREMNTSPKGLFLFTSKFCTVFLLFSLICSIIVDYCNAATLVGYSERQVWNFVENMPRENISDQCALSLNRVKGYLTNKATLEEQRNFYSQAFSTGEASQFISRDQDRWLFNAFKCIKSAGETSYSASQYPMHYCYGYNAESPKIAYGICIPSPCASDRKSLVKEWQALVSKNGDHQTLDYEDCTHSRHQKQWFEQTVPLVHFGSDIILVLIVGIATVYHAKRGDATKSFAAQLLLSFSMKKNVKKLIQMPKDPQSTITCMFGLRFLSMVWTLIGHSFIFVQAFLGNVDDFKNDLADNFWNQWITNFTLSVDVFLTLSGCLTAYTWFRKWQKNTTEPEPTWTSYAYWLRFYRHRIVRLWPAYIYTLVAVTTRVSITHYHPMWPPTDPAVQCPKHWWENVFFINSLTDNRCMPWTWYIGTEFIFYVLSPIFLLALQRNAVFGLSLSAGVIVASAVANAVTMVAYNFPPTQMLWKQPAIFSPDFILHHLVIYIKPWYRIGPYIVGIVLGYYLATSHGNLHKKKQRSPQFVIIGWAVAGLAGFWSIYGLYPSLQGWDWPVYHLIYGATSRTVFALALGWLIYACHTGIGGPLNAVLSFAPLLPLSILSYSVYLIHMIPVVFTYLLAPFPMQFTTKWDIFGHCVIQLAISYCFGMLCTMVAELPALNIERLLLGGHTSATRASRTSTAHHHPQYCCFKPLSPLEAAANGTVAGTLDLDLAIKSPLTAQHSPPPSPTPPDVASSASSSTDIINSQ